MYKTLKERVLVYSFAAGITLFGGGPNCVQTFPVRDRLPPKPVYQKINPVEKYALLVSDLSEFNTNYAVEKNMDDADSLALFRMYKVLTDSGFPDSHIFILYGAEGETPNFNVGNKKIAEQIREKQFNGVYDNTACEKNIEDILDGFKERVDGNDQLVVYIAGHGNGYGSIRIGKTKIYPYEIQDYVEGWKSNSNYFLLMNCASGKTIESVNVDNVFLFAASESDKSNWIDKHWCAGVEFLQNKTNMVNDTNKDGIVDCEEAVDKLRLSAAIYYHKLKTLLDYYYKRGKIDFNADDISLQPVIKVGDNFKKVNLK